MYIKAETGGIGDGTTAPVIPSYQESEAGGSEGIICLLYWVSLGQD